MRLDEAIASRYSARAFLETDVPNTLIEHILSMASQAPSGVNTQPWQVDVLSKSLISSIGNRIVALRESGVAENPDYCYYPKQWRSPYIDRRKACGLALYGALGISKDDAERRKAQWYKNYHFFGAPRGLIFSLDANLDKGSFLDLGMFIQTVMLCAKGQGLDTCPQASLSEFPDVIRDELGLGSDKLIICGLALGYADTSNPVNQYRTVREPTSVFTNWHEE